MSNQNKCHPLTPKPQVVAPITWKTNKVLAKGFANHSVSVGVVGRNNIKLRVEHGLRAIIYSN